MQANPLKEIAKADVVMGGDHFQHFQDALFDAHASLDAGHGLSSLIHEFMVPWYHNKSSVPSHGPLLGANGVYQSWIPNYGPTKIDGKETP